MKSKLLSLCFVSLSPSFSLTMAFVWRPPRIPVLPRQGPQFVSSQFKFWRKRRAPVSARRSNVQEPRPTNGQPPAKEKNPFPEWYEPGCLLQYIFHGSGTVVDTLVRCMQKFGGRLSLCTHVENVVVKNGRAISVKLRSGCVLWGAVECALGPGFGHENCDVKLLETPLTH